MPFPSVFRTACLALTVLALTACGFSTGPTQEELDQQERARRTGGSIFGNEGLSLDLGGGGGDGGGTGIGVNSFLWRASLDTISFFPLSQADPFGGVILTDWYSPPETPNVRFKLNVFILGRQLRADGLRVSVFKQERRSQAGAWGDASVAGDTVRSLENAILARARELRVAALAQTQ